MTLFGLGRSHAVYRGEGLGCYLDHGGAVADISVPAPDAKAALLPDIAGPSIVAPQTPQLAAALDRAFAEPDKSTPRHTRAIVVMKDGRVVAERYADGVGIDTPLLGFSATKSVISALAGILVRKGALKLRRAGADRSVAKPRRSKARHHARSSAAPHRGPCARQFAAGFAGVRAGAGQPHEVHGIGYGRLCGEHAARDRAGHRMELSRRQHRHPRVT